jgi:hypothetical protein
MGDGGDAMTMARAIPFLDIGTDAGDIGTDAGVCTHFHGGVPWESPRLGQVRWSFP